MTRAETHYWFTAIVSTGHGPKETLAQATVSSHFIITQSLGGESAGWNVAHVASGYKVAGPFAIRKARLIAAVFGALPIQWENVTKENSIAAWNARLSDWTEWRKSL